MRVALFTSFPPDIGGGAAILRSLIPELRGIEVTWFFLGNPVASWPGSRCLGSCEIGGALWRDMIRTPFLWAGLPVDALVRIRDTILSGDFDRHWIVAMNEGIILGRSLHMSAPEIPLHVTVHDDQPAWMWARSRRYKFLAPVVSLWWRRLLRSASSIDVISENMRADYKQLFGVDAKVVHSYVPSLPPDSLSVTLDAGRLTVGHIGSIYDVGDFQRFLCAVGAWARRSERHFRLLMIGMPKRSSAMLGVSGADEIEVIPHLEEPEAIRRLQECNFVYAMYPFNRASEHFRRTSLPTKLSTYVQAQRPILAHTPDDSTLAALVREFDLGAVASTLECDELDAAFERVTAHSPGYRAFDAAREKYFGRTNIESLLQCLAAG